MKKLCAIVLLAAILTMAGCSSKPSSEPTAAPSEAPPASPSATPSDDGEMQQGSTPESQVAARIETEEMGEYSAEYIQVSGLPDEDIQDALNNELKMFGTWGIDNEGGETITATAEYSIIGDSYISVRQIQTTYVEDAAYPTSVFNSQLFSLETGMSVDISEFMVVDDELADAIESGVFVQIYPEEIEGAAEMMVEEFVDNGMEYETRFYLTEMGIGIYINERLHVEGDYWVFEAEYGDIERLLTVELLDILGL